MANKTVHVLPKDGHWVVAREGRKKYRIFATQRDAIHSAKMLVKRERSGQLAIHSRDGRIRRRDTYGMPVIQDPPGRKSARIEEAVEKITRHRLEADPQPPRG